MKLFNQHSKFWSKTQAISLGVLISLMNASSSAVAEEKADAAKDGAQTNQAEAWRKTPPPIPAPRPYKLPTVTSYTLDNGLNVQLLEDHRVPFVTVNLGMQFGSVLDPKDMLGLAAVTADMLTEGTTTKSSKQIAEEVDFIGGGLKAASDSDFTLLTGSSLSGYTDRLFAMISDVLLNPTFPDNELKLKKTNILQELVMKRTQPDFLSDERFSKVVFGDHPYSVVAPTPETVKNLNRDALQNFHKQNYLPNRAYLVVVGDFDMAKMKELIAKSLGSNWKSGNAEAVTFEPAKKQNGRRIYLVDRPGSVQTSIKVGNLGIKKTDPDYFPLMVANEILGGSAHSRLFTNIREEKGYTYGAYSGFSASKEPGSFAEEAEVRTEVTGPALFEFLHETARIRNLKATDTELKDAKNYLVGSFQLGLETQAGLARRLLEGKLYNLPANYLETYADKIMAVNLNDVRRVANGHMDIDNMVITVVGDAGKIKEELEFFGPVEVYDVNGKIIKTAAAKSEGTK